MRYSRQASFPTSSGRPPGRIAEDNIVSKHVEVYLLESKVTLGDRIPELMKEFKVLLSSNVRGYTSSEGEKAEDQGRDVHRCGLRQNRFCVRDTST